MTTLHCWHFPRHLDLPEIIHARHPLFLWTCKSSKIWKHLSQKFMGSGKLEQAIAECKAAEMRLKIQYPNMHIYIHLVILLHRVDLYNNKIICLLRFSRPKLKPLSWWHPNGSWHPLGVCTFVACDARHDKVKCIKIALKLKSQMVRQERNDWWMHPLHIKDP